MLYGSYQFSISTFDYFAIDFENRLLLFKINLFKKYKSETKNITNSIQFLLQYILKIGTKEDLNGSNVQNIKDECFSLSSF